MLWKLSKKFQFAADNVIPDSFVFCIILTIIVFVLGLIFTDASLLAMTTHWYSGLWSMLTFAFQMSFMVIVCGAAAKASQIKKLLSKIARLPNSRPVAMVFLLLFGFASSLINWAFSLIVTPIFAIELSKNIKGLHFPLMIAAGYSTMILGQCWCPAASVYALVATEGHFMESVIGVLTQAETVYNPINTILWFFLVGVTILIVVFTKPYAEEIVMYVDKEGETVDTDNNKKPDTFSQKMNNSKVFMWVLGIAGITNIIRSFVANGIIPSLNFNFIIFIFLTANFFLYNTPIKFVNAIKNSMKPASQVMLQFPFYGGIMGMMSGSGLTHVLANSLIKIATERTLPFFAYLSASVVNLFVPSQGGQWIVQGPIMVEVAEKMNVDLPLIINAFVYGDEATNMIQPLYVIPAISLVGMKLKDVWGFMAFIWLFWFIVTSLGLLFLPGIM
ncbi:MAG: short-chain fatty acid transporter [Firmicutes bacterium]|nr:short-chain fatty acid transporter [Bacillota bacterium]